VDEDESSWPTIRELVGGQPTILHPIAGPKDGRIRSLQLGLSCSDLVGGETSNMFLFSPQKLGKILSLMSIFFRWVGNSTTN